MSKQGREFDSIVGGKKVRLKLLAENMDIERRADTEYHIAYTQLMKRGILPRATLEKQMKELEIWTEKDEEQLTDLQRQLADLQLELERSETHEKGLEIAKSMGELRADCLKLIEAKSTVLINSCEELASSIRRDAYIAFATVYADTGIKVFKDYHDLIVRAEEKVVTDARNQLFEMMSDTFQTSLNTLPEIAYVREVESQMKKDDQKVSQSQSKKKRKKRTKKVVKKG